MYSKAQLPAGFISIDASVFDTRTIVATLQRLLAESPRFDHTAELLDFQVLGYREAAPATMRVVATVGYQANHCVVEVPYDVDAGALKGLECGVGAD